jgi:hypothetical protein
MDEVVDERERIAVLPGDRIQSSVVLDEAELSVLLDEEDRSSEGGLSGDTGGSADASEYPREHLE